MPWRSFFVVQVKRTVLFLNSHFTAGFGFVQFTFAPMRRLLTKTQFSISTSPFHQLRFTPMFEPLTNTQFSISMSPSPREAVAE